MYFILTVFILNYILQPSVTWSDKIESFKTKIKGKIFLLIGDSMMGGAVGYYLSDSLKAEGADRVIIDFHTSSGLCRPDFYNWKERVDELLYSKSFDVVFIFIGANDNQAIHNYGEGWLRRHSGSWYEEYHNRVGKMMDGFLQEADLVYWIGLPKMMDPNFDDGIVIINEIYEQEALSREKVVYIPSYDVFANPSYNLNSLRTEDGCHFTGEGAKLLINRVFEFIQ